MYSFEQARAKAEDVVSGMYRELGNAEIVVNDQFIRERERGWVFPYNTKAYLRSGKPQEGLIGNGPIFVDRFTGEVFRMPSGGWKRMLDEYDQSATMPTLAQGMQRISPGEQPHALDGIADKLRILKS